MLAAELRAVVGYLAEQQNSWVASQFFGPRSLAFLTPVFARTAFQAQYQGVTFALARLHDEHIGTGATSHLFRLPEIYEQGIAASLIAPGALDQIKQSIATPDHAAQRLSELAIPASAVEGAIVVSGSFRQDVEALLGLLAGMYADAFQRGIKTFPFVREA